MPQANQSNSPLEPASPDQGEAVRRLLLVKDKQRYVVRYEPGEESMALRSLVELAKDPSNDFNWFDAAMLCHQLGRGMSGQLQQLLQV